MKLLVLGRDGQVGRAILDVAATTGLDAVGAGRNEADLTRPVAVRALILREGPEIIVNAAAFTAVDQAETDPEQCFAVNAEGAGVLAQAARDAGARLVHISTDYVFDGALARPYRETDRPRPINTYGQSKLAGEEAVRLAHRDHLILRTAWIHSPYGRNFVKTMVTSAGSRDEVRVVDDQFGSPTAAHDLARGIFAALAAWPAQGAAGSRTYHLCGIGVASWAGIAEVVMEECRALGYPSAAVVPVATSEWRAAAVRPAYSALDSSAFARDFRFNIRAWQESVRETVRAVTKSRS